MAASKPAGADDREQVWCRARDLVLRYGWNATAYQILNPGIDLWFSAAGDSVVGFTVRRGVRVVAGAPVCAAERLAEVALEFERDASVARQTVCYFCAEGRLEALCRDSPAYSMVSLGAQPVWVPGRWRAATRSKPSLRAQLNRAHHKGVYVEEWEPRRAEASAELHGCLHEWLGAKGLPPLRFLVEPETLGRLGDRRTFVACRAASPIGFALASPVPARNGWLIEQVVRRPSAPNGTAELMLDAAIGTLADDGAEYVTLGLAPLSHRGAPSDGDEPLWLRAVLGWLRAHGRRFYNFRGLEAFKAKFGPDHWDPVYAVSNERPFSPSTLYGVAAAFGGGSPIVLLAKAFSKAAKSEMSWLLSRMAN